MSSNTEPTDAPGRDTAVGTGGETIDEVGGQRPGDLFCDCGGLLVPDEPAWRCQSCDATGSMDGVAFGTVEEQERRNLSVVDERFFRGPKTDATCPDCGHDEAYFLLAQLRSADESETRMFTCADCGHNWRDDD